MRPVPFHILPVIIFSQFAGTSLWFAGNAILPDLVRSNGFNPTDLGVLTSSVQFGFIAGTLLFAILTIADKFSPSKIFFTCSLLAAGINVSIILLPVTLTNLLVVRFSVGFLLAGIYPVGMKLAADWYQKSLSKAIGFLVGALVLGTAFPHLVRGLGATFAWQQIMVIVSGIAVFGGIMVLLLVPDGPHRKRGSGFRPEAVLTLFKNRDLRSATFGYFGHMWELYTMWAFVPIIIGSYNSATGYALDVSVWSFLVIAMGFFGCGLGGLIALNTGSASVATYQLSGSLICILLTPFVHTLPLWLFISYLMIWGTLVVGDSPQFSALAARTAPPELVGSALTIMNSIGFALTIPSIMLANYLISNFDHPAVLLFLAPGPLLGLMAVRRLYLARY